MELADALAGRRSCRDYSGAPIDPVVLRRVLAAAHRAPSAGNTWALDLVVVTDPREYWGVTLPDATNFRWPGLLRAPVLVLPVVDPGAYVRRYAEPDKAHSGLGIGADAWSVPYWWVDGGAAVMAMLLAATDAGLGALLFGQFGHETAVAERFGIPVGHRALGTVALGYPGAGTSRSRSDLRGRPSPEDRVHLNGW